MGIEVFGAIVIALFEELVALFLQFKGHALFMATETNNLENSTRASPMPLMPMVLLMVEADRSPQNPADSAVYSGAHRSKEEIC